MRNKIVVCFSSHHSDSDNENFVKHIKDTIGNIPCEVTSISNHNQYSLAYAYNYMLSQINKENAIVVMCHNDIVFKTKNWGKILLKKFNNSNYDIIGVAGTTLVPKSGMWWEDSNKMLGIVSHTNGLNEWTNEYSKPRFNIEPVVAIDGLFMAFNPETIVHTFDESFNGFHFYDIPFCLKNHQDGCNIGVIYDIRILHKSIGMTNDEWENNRKQFISKFSNILPYNIEDWQ